MLNWLKRLTECSERLPLSARDQQRAAAALMYEVARADGQWQSSERAALLWRMAERWQLAEREAEELLEEAEHVAENATDYHQMVRTLQDWLPDQRAALVHDMWQVAHADQQVHPMEEYVIRKVADLLHVAHHEFIRGKLIPDLQAQGVRSQVTGSGTPATTTGKNNPGTTE